MSGSSHLDRNGWPMEAVMLQADLIYSCGAQHGDHGPLKEELFKILDAHLVRRVDVEQDNPDDEPATPEQMDNLLSAFVVGDSNGKVDPPLRTGLRVPEQGDTAEELREQIALLKAKHHTRYLQLLNRDSGSALVANDEHFLDAVMALIAYDKAAMLDRIEQSIKQHNIKGYMTG